MRRVLTTDWSQMDASRRSSDAIIFEQEHKLREWFTQKYDPIRKVVESLDIGWGGVQRWATGRMPMLTGGPHLDFACGYATFLAQLGWRFPGAELVGLNIDFNGAHALAQPLLAEAGVEATLVQADARRMPFVDESFASVSCFLGLQDIEIGFGERGVHEAVSEAMRVLRPGGVLVLVDEFSFERYKAMVSRLPIVVTDRAERGVDVRWSREVGERAIALYAEGWVAQTCITDPMEQERVRVKVYRQMVEEMEEQLATQGCYVPLGPVRLVVGRKVRGVAA
jgi:SAM-dependent methyltransferase